MLQARMPGSIDLAWDQGLENALTLTAANPNASFRGFANPTPPPNEHRLHVAGPWERFTGE